MYASGSNAMFAMSQSVEEMFGVVLVECVFSVDFHIRDMCRWLILQYLSLQQKKLN